MNKRKFIQKELQSIQGLLLPVLDHLEKMVDSKETWAHVTKAFSEVSLARLEFVVNEQYLECVSCSYITTVDQLVVDPRTESTTVLFEDFQYCPSCKDSSNFYLTAKQSQK